GKATGRCPRQPLSPHWRAINRARSRTRARGEHPLHAVKRLWGFAKVRYRGIAKNLARAFSLFALANLYLVRRQLLLPRRGASCESWVERGTVPAECAGRDGWPTPGSPKSSS